MIASQNWREKQHPTIHQAGLPRCYSYTASLHSIFRQVISQSTMPWLFEKSALHAAGVHHTHKKKQLQAKTDTIKIYLWVIPMNQAEAIAWSCPATYTSILCWIKAKNSPIKHAVKWLEMNTQQALIVSVHLPFLTKNKKSLQCWPRKKHGTSLHKSTKHSRVEPQRPTPLALQEDVKLDW